MMLLHNLTANGGTAREFTRRIHAAPRREEEPLGAAVAVAAVVVAHVEDVLRRQLLAELAGPQVERAPAKTNPQVCRTDQ